MNTILSLIVQLFHMPSVLVYFLLEFMFPNVDREALELAALTSQWLFYGVLAAFVVHHTVVAWRVKTRPDLREGP